MRWFAPAGDASRAITQIREHNALARSHLPAYFPEAPGVELAPGAWPEFLALCNCVRDPSNWDWKYGALKRLSHEHSVRHGFEVATCLRYVDVPPGSAPPDDALFFLMGEAVIHQQPGPRFELPADAPRERRGEAGWYIGYAVMDLFAPVEWQLAEGHDALDGNPFVPLLDVYAGGWLPFSVGIDRMILFGMAAAGRRRGGPGEG